MKRKLLKDNANEVIRILFHITELNCLIFLFCNCSQPELNLETSKRVVVIFQDAPDQSSTDRFLGTLHAVTGGTLIYMDSVCMRIGYVPRSIGYDTLTIPALYGYAEVQHRNAVIDDISYLLRGGDTVLFTYEANGRPQLRSLTCEENTWLYNLPWTDPRSVQPNGYSTAAMLRSHEYISAYNMTKKKNVKLPDELRKKVMRYVVNIDSLREVYEKYRIRTRVMLDSLVEMERIPQVYSEYYKSVHLVNPDEIAEPAASDSLLHYISAYDRLMAYAYRGQDVSSVKRFDMMAEDKKLSLVQKRIVLREIMGHIQTGDLWETYPAETINRYRDKYFRITGDTCLSTPSLHKDNVLLNGYTNDLLLERLDGRRLSLGEVLLRNKGKVLYVDIWASWCAPCRAEMPIAKDLREEYRGRDVVFLYLAIHDSHENWRRAVSDLQTDVLGDNCRILNPGESRFLKEIHHTRIPHTLLYDHTGRLVDVNAPRPSDPLIKEKIDNLLNIPL